MFDDNKEKSKEAIESLTLLAIEKMSRVLIRNGVPVDFESIQFKEWQEVELKVMVEWYKLIHSTRHVTLRIKIKSS